MKRAAALLAPVALVAVLTLAGCGHPGIPAPALRPARLASPPRAAGGQPMLGVDLYALRNYPPAVVAADGRRMLAYIKNVLNAGAVGIVRNFYAASSRSSAVEATGATLPAASVAILTRIAERDHLRVEYRPLIMVQGNAAWEGNIAPDQPARWFSSYYNAELPYLKAAQRLGVSEFVAATEMHTAVPRSFWGVESRSVAGRCDVIMCGVLG